MKKIIHILLATLLISMLMVGCSDDNKNKEDNYDKIGIRGIVTSISTDEKLGNIEVEGKLENDTMYDKAVVEITENTLIQKDDLSRLFDISNIEKGMYVEVVFNDDVKEMHPVQGTADIVRIITVNSQN